MAKNFDKDFEERGYFGIDSVMRVVVALNWLVENPKGYPNSFERLWE